MDDTHGGRRLGVGRDVPSIIFSPPSHQLTQRRHANQYKTSEEKIFACLAGNNGLLACSLLPIATSAFGLHRVLLPYVHTSRYLLTEAITAMSLTTPLSSCAV